MSATSPPENGPTSGTAASRATLGRSRRWRAEAVAAIVAIVLGAGWLTYEAGRGGSELQTLRSPARLRSAAADLARWDCIARRIGAQVPARAAVRVLPPDEGSTTYQRLVELATPAHPVRAAAGPGVFTLTLADGGGNDSCDGMLLVVSRP